MTARRVMLVDDHALVRMGFRMPLAACEDLEVVAEADNGEEALQAPRRAASTWWCWTFSHARHGVGWRRCAACAPGTPGWACWCSPPTMTVRMPAGRWMRGEGFLSKRGAPEALTQALRCVADGRRYLDAGIAQQLALAALDGSHHPADALSAREFEVFVQLARGRSVQEIAGDLNLSTSTVGTPYLYHVKQKLNASNQAELTLLALRWGLIER